MFYYSIDDVNIESDIEFTTERLNEIIANEQTKINRPLALIQIRKLNEEEAEIITKPKAEIRRIRRISGYLSELDNFNPAKKSEANDRIRHL